MDPSLFRETRFGRAREEPGNPVAFWYYNPAPIPRELEFQPATVRALSDADAALGRLHGLGALIKRPELLLGPYLHQEAVASSRIEGTHTSLSEVLRAEAGGAAPDEDIAEVERYIAATHQGYALIKDLPITQCLILQLHATLMSGVRGQEKLPGEYRRSPVWVGSPTDTPDSAAYVLPLPAEIPDLLTDWEQFVNGPRTLPALIRCALMHYQFETIHPFLDGNGRIGRLLVNLLLLAEGRLGTPLLYLSGYLERHRREYYARLQGVREVGEIQEWLQFFLTAVHRSADDAVLRAERLVHRREGYLTEAMHSRSNLPRLVDLMFENPFLTVARAERLIGLTNQGARNLLKDASRRGWLTELGPHGKGGSILWVAQDVFDIVEAPMTYDR